VCNNFVEDNFKKNSMRVILFLAVVIIFFSCEKTSDGSSANASAASAGAVGKGGSLARFTIVDNYMYLVDVSTLKVFNINNPQTATLATTIYLPFGVETIFPYKDKLFIGSRDGMYIYSLANPAAPVKLGEARHVRSCDPVVANDSIAFVTLLGNQVCGPAQSGLYIYNITNLTSPTLIKTNLMNTPVGLGLADSILYVCQKSNGMSIFNVSNPAVPILRKTITTQTFEDVIPYNNLLICYISTGLILYDISNRANPVQVALINN
jgi:hypothetical protein